MFDPAHNLDDARRAVEVFLDMTGLNSAQAISILINTAVLERGIEPVAAMLERLSIDMRTELPAIIEAHNNGEHNHDD